MIKRSPDLAGRGAEQPRQEGTDDRREVTANLVGLRGTMDTWLTTIPETWPSTRR
jgi:hypothetical protein